MATFGSVINATVEDSITDIGSGYIAYVGGQILVSGTITALKVYCSNRGAATPNYTYNDCDFAIYKGGTSSSNPTNATLLWSSKRYLGATLGTGTDWHSIVDGSSQPATGDFAANDYLWVMIRSNDGFGLGLNTTSKGDWAIATERYNAGVALGNPYPASFAGDGSSWTTAIKAYIEYTAGASGVIPSLSRFYNSLKTNT